MSHRATNWLSEIEPALIGSAEFRVLFHLCDCHNPSKGCFPTQEYLRDRCGVSNGTLNNALNALETKGLIQRHRERDGRSKKQKPTRYMLGFEIARTQTPSPETGDGKSPKPSPETGDGAVSSLRGKPSPISGGGPSPVGWRVTCKEPVINQGACAQGEKKTINPMVIKAAEAAVAAWRGGRADAFDDLQPWVRAHVRAGTLLTQAERARLGWDNLPRKGDSDD